MFTCRFEIPPGTYWEGAYFEKITSLERWITEENQRFTENRIGVFQESRIKRDGLVFLELL